MFRDFFIGKVLPLPEPLEHLPLCLQFVPLRHFPWRAFGLVLLECFDDHLTYQVGQVLLDRLPHHWLH